MMQRATRAAFKTVAHRPLMRAPAALSVSTQQRSYAKGRGRQQTEDTDNISAETSLFEAAARDYLREPPVEQRKSAVDSPLQKEKNKHLADGYNQYVNVWKNKFRAQEIRKAKLVDAAMLALPEPLRLEAEKSDWTPFPDFIHAPATLPPTKGYQGLEMQLRNDQ